MLLTSYSKTYQQIDDDITEITTSIVKDDVHDEFSFEFENNNTHLDIKGTSENNKSYRVTEIENYQPAINYDLKKEDLAKLLFEKSQPFTKIESNTKNTPPKRVPSKKKSTHRSKTKKFSRKRPSSS